MGEYGQHYNTMRPHRSLREAVKTLTCPRSLYQWLGLVWEPLDIAPKVDPGARRPPGLLEPGRRTPVGSSSPGGVGRSSLYSRRHAAIRARASGRERDHAVLRSSCRRRALKDSMKVLSDGRGGAREVQSHTGCNRPTGRASARRTPVRCRSGSWWGYIVPAQARRARRRRGWPGSGPAARSTRLSRVWQSTTVRMLKGPAVEQGVAHEVHAQAALSVVGRSPRYWLARRRRGVLRRITRSSSR